MVACGMRNNVVPEPQLSTSCSVAMEAELSETPPAHVTPPNWSRCHGYYLSLALLSRMELSLLTRLVDCDPHD